MIFPDTSSEEPLAPVTTYSTIMLPSCTVPTNQAGTVVFFTLGVKNKFMSGFKEKSCGATKWHKILQNGTIYYKMAQNTKKWHKMLQNGTKYYKKNATKWLLVVK